MYVCNHCGELREELRTFKQHCGETTLGNQFYETLEDDNCHCGGTFVEATQCEICGEWFDNNTMYGVCEACLEENETVGTALEIGRLNKEDVCINGFVANVLDGELINKILEKWVEENFVDHSNPVVKYCEDDKAYFSEYLADKYGE